jgi:hypothetical protein
VQPQRDPTKVSINPTPEGAVIAEERQESSDPSCSKPLPSLPHPALSSLTAEELLEFGKKEHDHEQAEFSRRRAQLKEELTPYQYNSL